MALMLSFWYKDNEMTVQPKGVRMRQRIIETNKWEKTNKPIFKKNEAFTDALLVEMFGKIKLKNVI